MCAQRSTSFVAAPDGTTIAWHAHGKLPLPGSARGARTTLLLTNGLGTSEGFWKHLVTAFANEYNVVHWDYRGHGQSAPATTGDYTIRTHADDLARVTQAVVEQTGGGPPIHVGFSMGVTVTLELYRMRRDLVSALILLGGPADAPHATTFPFRIPGVLRLVESTLAVLLPFALVGAPLFHAFATSRFAYPVVRMIRLVEPTAPREDIEGMAAVLARMDVRAFWSSMVSLMGAHASDVLPKVRVPALVIGAAHDKFVPKAQIRQLSLLLPDATTVMIDNAGHGVLVEAGPKVAAAIRSFVQSRDVLGRG
jgi:pimeloyl-ACP methyl ester carboxylesterase